MKKHNLGVMLVLLYVTLGLYWIYWIFDTTAEMNKQGANIPNDFLIIVPFVNFWWLWRYCQAVEQTTGGNMPAVLAYALVLSTFICLPGVILIQRKFNSIVTQASGSALNVTTSAPVIAVPAIIQTASPNQMIIPQSLNIPQSAGIPNNVDQSGVDKTSS